MQVFVTGATGFIGLPVVKELVSAGHRVLGLSRSDKGDHALQAAGAEPHRGSLEDQGSLRRGAAASEAVIHLAFVHDFSRFKENCELDEAAIRSLGAELSGSKRPLIVTAGVGGLAGPGQLATEDTDVPSGSPLPRVSEQTALGLVGEGVEAAVVRLPQVHDTVKQGLVTYLIDHARQKGVSAYIGEGTNRWAAGHITDVARLYRLALEKHQTGARYHAVGEEGVPMRSIAEAIGRGLKLPVVSLSPDEAQTHFGWLGMFAAHDLGASSTRTRQQLGWEPAGPGLIADLDAMQYG